MRAGLLRTPITLLRRENKADAYSSGTPVYVPALTTRARIQYEKGGLSDQIGEPVYEELVIATIRHYHRIKPDWRVEFAGQRWQQIRPPVEDILHQCQYLYLRPLNT